ncbi:unnamed protein product [Rotaria sordida]|uniref:SAM dependent carboxyl methyltransferase n=1 Tax=Rotaria sordida TaxID=392033 RepID=A0A814A8M0_9BILA|nr:unnamed protein product [Rotaria sordida]CAF0911303.1 unnamed protein product [Rotaria sordida]
MSLRTIESSNTMKQNEHYNLHSTPQLTAIEKSFTYIQKAIEEHKASFSLTDIFFIVDYGCAQGTNAVVAIEAIVEAVQQKYGTAISNQICTVFNDLPTNDWSALIKTISKSSFTSLASGKSFYEQILPSNTVQFGYTSSAIHWLSKKPCNLHRHCFVLAGQSTAEEMAMWKAQAAEDYKIFLQHRSNELKKGAVLLCVTLSRDNSNNTGNLPTYDNLYQSATAVLDEDELLNYNIQGYYRSLEEQTDPILLSELNFELIYADLYLLQHPIYENYRLKNIDFKEFIEKFTEFVRSWAEMSLINCLRKDRTEEERTKIIEDFWNEFRNGMQLRGAEHFNKNPYRSYIILRKL